MSDMQFCSNASLDREKPLLGTASVGVAVSLGEHLGGVVVRADAVRAAVGDVELVAEVVREAVVEGGSG